jgi:hypothetical protein
MKLDGQKLKDHIWSECLNVSVEMQYSKSKVLKAKYDTLSEIWNGINAGTFNIEEGEPT